jgi:HAD superfamily hydrolase (TIGR01662 family)
MNAGSRNGSTPTGEGRLPTTVVIPTIGRPSLTVLFEALEKALQLGPAPEAVIVVDDREPGIATKVPLDVATRLPLQVVRSGGRGPAAARNRGWRRARTPWVSFLDDDVVPDTDWLAKLAEDLRLAAPDVAGIQGRVVVPLPTTRRPTDWERGTAGLATAAWITADMTYRRYDLACVGGFDERFPRAFREDADLALRMLARGRRLACGRRGITHPVRPASDWVSVRVQRGNADDALMAGLHGRDWWERAQAPRGRSRSQRAMTAALGVAVTASLLRRPRIAAIASTGYVAGVAEFAWRRIQPGPRDAAEVRRMLLTSAVIPVAACWHGWLGAWRHRRAVPWVGEPDVVLFDRDGTLVHDVPYNGDPSLVEAMPGARDLLDALREHGVRVGLVTNQSGIGTGRISRAQAEAVNAEVARRLGPFDVVLMCPHRPSDGCECRKPAPGLVREACVLLDAPPERVVVVGDIRADVEAARAASVGAILVPNDATAPSDLDVSVPVLRDLAAVGRQLLKVS